MIAIIRQPHFVRATGLLIGLAAAIMVIRLGTLGQGYRFLEKFPPDFSTVGWMRFGGSAIAAFLIYLALRPARHQTRPFLTDCTSTRVGKLYAWVSLLTVAATMAGVVLIPQRLYPLVTDGAVVQTISELFLAIAIGLALFAAVRSRTVAAARIGIVPAPLVFAAMALVTFLILGEEMSWGQHLIGWQTPDTFAGNIQNETNLHNFYTYRFETAYYLSALVLFFVLPYAWPKVPGRWLKPFAFFVPPAGFVLIAAPISGLFYEYWNVVPMQVAFALGVILLVDCAFDRSRGTPGARAFAGLWAVTMIASQAVFLVFGGRMSEGHELSEVREFLISLLMLAYLIWISGRLLATSRGLA
ncbi:hypothetical protein [Nitratireductor alexandrii]|uniref:hypothetical protein n=1 Tax=Nitratireductor alexandrii TaxID=2448161 RepID=UPI000FD76551|nr:hypothetical protein [Nitratireductor alexandrii]